MGTPEQRARRQRYAANVERLIGAMSQGGIRSDADLRSWLQANGMNPDGPIFKQYYSGGGYSTYGPSWDPVWNFDFEHGQKIPYQGPGESWYDPSVASNWQNTDPTQAARMSGFFKFWKDTPEGQALANQYGGNSIAAWYALRNRSNRPNAPDESWHTEGNFTSPSGQNYSNLFGSPFSSSGANASASLPTSTPDTGGSSMSIAGPAPVPSLGSDNDPWTLAKQQLRKRFQRPVFGSQMESL